MRSTSPSMQPRERRPSGEGAVQTGASRKAARSSPQASPSMLGFSPVAEGGEGAEPPALELPTALMSGIDGVALNAGKVPVPAPVPEAPPTFQRVSLVSDTSGIGADEAYSHDEEQLNLFLKLHPMLSLEATSQRTLQLLSGMFEKVSIQSPDLPVVPKSHDDLFLAPADEAIGERACVNGQRCLAQFIAKLRYGTNTDMAFTCKEFLLPTEHDAFKAGRGLPQRRKKCLLCTRYFQNYVFLLGRTDPAFKIGTSPLGVQVFCNPVTEMPAPRVPEEADLQQAASEMPTHVCAVSKRDGYKPDATLFVDEDWMALRSAREGNAKQLLFRPVVRFCSTHYKYVKDKDGVRIVQVGIGADDNNDGLHFAQPPVRTAAAPAAKQEEPPPVHLH